jgi:hypothetical protein
MPLKLRLGQRLLPGGRRRNHRIRKGAIPIANRSVSRAVWNVHKGRVVSQPFGAEALLWIHCDGVSHHSINNLRPSSHLRASDFTNKKVADTAVSSIRSGRRLATATTTAAATGPGGTTSSASPTTTGTE